MVLSHVQVDTPMAIVRAAAWSNSLARMGVHLPLFVIHDIGVMLSMTRGTGGDTIRGREAQRAREFGEPRGLGAGIDDALQRRADAMRAGDANVIGGLDGDTHLATYSRRLFGDGHVAGAGGEYTHHAGRRRRHEVSPPRY